MTIQEGDIKLLTSRVMDDVPEGGGGPTGTEVPYGTSNAVFADITEADRAGGNVSIRQLHAAVMTATTDPLMGSSIILSQPPSDPNVAVTLAKCGLFARRSAIAQSIANYLIQGTTWSGVLLEDHVIGMRSIQILHRPGTPAPDIGRTLVLAYQQGTSTERIQYVRVTRTETEQRTFTYSLNGQFVDFQGAVTKVDLSDALRYEFPGSPPSRDYSTAAGKTIIRDTTVADAATYYGASPVASAVALGDSTLRVASIYTQLVPSSRTETTALDQRPAAERTVVLATAPRRVEVPVAAHTRRIKIGQSNRGFSFVALLKPLPEPGTVIVSYRALGNWYTLADDGEGLLTGAGSGRVIYTTGSMDMTLQALPDDASSIVIQWAERVAFTNRATQGASINAPLTALRLANPGATPTTVTVRWASGGILRAVTDDGAGRFSGEATGTIDYPSSSLLLSTPYMIDAGGEWQVEYSFGAQVEQLFSSPGVDATGSATLVLQSQPVAGSIEVSWTTSQEVTQTGGGSLTTLSAVTNDESKRYWVGWSDGFGYHGWRTRKEGTSATLTRQVQRDSSNSRRVIVSHRASDDGSGGFALDLGAVLYSSKTITLKLVDQTKTTESYKSDHEDAKSFQKSISSDDQYGGGSSESSSASSKGGEYGTTTVGEQVAGNVIVRYKVAPLASTAATESFAGGAVSIDICPLTVDSIVPGSVRFVWMGQTYDDFEGVIYRGRTDSVAGQASGTIDYAAGRVNMTDWIVGLNPGSVSLQSLWTRRAPWTTASIFFRTQSAPLKPGGLVLTLTDVSGNALTATTNLDGSFAGTHMLGRMDFESGVGELQFGDFIDAATLTDSQKAEWWYSAADVGAVQSGKIWRPWPVDPTTLRYNSVSYAYLPLDADILGLDPVRLPPDGRVPIFRVGSYVVISYTGRIAAATYSAGMTIDCARTRLSRVYLVGADGKLIRSGYSVNLDAGTVAITDVTGWVQPVVIKHRIEEMARLADVQINGALRLTKQLSHVFPAGSIVSAAIMAGNLRARALPVFDQQSWDGITWADTTVGNPASATYNDGAYPINVTNAGAMTERFALRVLSGGMDVEVIGEHVGNLGTFTRNAVIAPINPVSGVPFFRLDPLGWGAGWAAGNVLFLPTVGTYYPFAAIRTTQPSEAVGTDFAFELTARGDVDRAPTNPVI